jgi:hypothetical protein
MTFTIGAIDMIFAAGKQSAIVIEIGRTINGEGAIPNIQCVIAPMETVGPAIFIILFLIRVPLRLEEFKAFYRDIEPSIVNCGI